MPWKKWESCKCTNGWLVSTRKFWYFYGTDIRWLEHPHRRWVQSMFCLPLALYSWLSCCSCARACVCFGLFCFVLFPSYSLLMIADFLWPSIWKFMSSMDSYFLNSHVGGQSFSFSKGQVILTEGEFWRRIYNVTMGSVSVHKYDKKLQVS